MPKKKLKFLAVIPARAGSKGIKNKNIRPFCGKPLIAYSIEEAKKSKKLDRVVVSTDSAKYARVAKKYGAEVPFLRSKKLAGDKSLILDVIIDLLERLKKRENYVPDYVVLLQTTSPLRTVKDIDKCVDLMLKKRGDAVITMCSADPYLFSVKDGYLNSLTPKRWLSSTNRQSLPQTYRINGPAVLITERKSIFKNNSLWKGRVAPVIMPKWRSFDLDKEEDFALAEIVYKNRR